MKGLLKRHYHWIIAGIALLDMFVYVGIINNITGLYLVPVTESLGISRASFSLAFSVRSIVGAVAVILSGPVVRKLGFRRTAPVALVLASIAFVNLSLCKNLPMLFVSTVLIGVCDGFCSNASAVYIISNWFHKFRGSMLGLVTAFTGVGGSAFCMIITGITGAAGWRMSLLVCAGCTAVTAAVLAILSRSRPEDLGLKPLGDGERHNSPKKRDKDHWHGFTVQELVRQPNFYLTMLGVFVTNLCLYMVYYNIVPYLQDCGLSVTQAAAMQSVMLLVMAGFKLLCGMFSDWIGAKWVTGICTAALVGSMVLFVTVSGAVTAWAAVLVFALALPMMSVTIPLLTASLFGYHSHSSISGIFLALPSVAAVLASPIANTVRDRTGSYLGAFGATTVAAAIALGLHGVICILARRNRTIKESTTEGQNV